MFLPPLVLQYDEFDNAALTMITHSPTAWDHVHFKDVLVKVSNVEVYYKAISFYLAEHPDLLTDMLKVREGAGISYDSQKNVAISYPRPQ